MLPRAVRVVTWNGSACSRITPSSPPRSTLNLADKALTPGAQRSWGFAAEPRVVGDRSNAAPDGIPPGALGSSEPCLRRAVAKPDQSRRDGHRQPDEDAVGDQAVSQRDSFGALVAWVLGCSVTMLVIGKRAPAT